jgi:hypothetical protein
MKGGPRIVDGHKASLKSFARTADVTLDEAVAELGPNA